MKRIAPWIAFAALAAAACGGHDSGSTPEPTSPPAVTTTIPPRVLDEAAAAARRQVELGGLRGDLDYAVADAFLNPSNSCAAIVFTVSLAGGETLVSTAYMVRTEGRGAAEIFPRVEAMQPSYLEQWDAVVGNDEWGLLALAPPETDVNDVAALCGDSFLDEALRRHFAVQIAPE